MSLVLLLGNRSANESLRRQLASPRSTPLFGLTALSFERFDLTCVPTPQL